MASYDGAVTLSTALDNEQLEKDLRGLDNKFGDGLKDITDGFENAGDSASGFADVLRGNLLSEVIVSGLQGLASNIKNMDTDFIDAAATVKAETSQFEQTFGALQSSASEAIERVADTSGILETRLNTLGSSIYAFARSSGGDTVESMELMEKALQAAADGAAYYDRSIEDTAETLQSFLKGNYENDAALGLSATEATRNAAAMDLFGAAFNDLSEIQKQQTLLQMVLDAQKLSGAMGQAAREADGWENVQGNLNESWRQFMAKAGAPLLESLVPIIQEITTGLIEWTSSVDWPAFSDVVKGFVGTLVENGPTILSVIAGVGAGFVAWNVFSMINGVVTAVKAFKTANEGATVAQALLNGVMNANPFMLVATLIAGVVTALVVLWNTNEDFRAAVMRIWESIKGAFAQAWETIKGVWDAVKPYFEAVWESIKSAFSVVAKVLGDFFSDAWEAIKKVWGAVSGYFQTVWDTIKGIFSVVKSVLSRDFEGAWEAIKGIVSGWAKYFSGVWDNIKKVFSNAWTVFKDIGRNIVDGIKQGISNAWSSFKSWVGGLFDGLVDGVKNLLGIHSPSRVFAQIGDYMMQGLADGMNGGSTLAVQSAKNMTAAVIKATATRLPMLTLPQIAAGGISIPRLATGAVIPPNREFLAVLGDQKSGTNIEAPEELIRKIVREESGGMNTELLEAILAAIKAGHVMKVDKRVLAETAVDGINNMTRSAGKPVLKL